MISEAEQKFVCTNVSNVSNVSLIFVALLVESASAFNKRFWRSKAFSKLSEENCEEDGGRFPKDKLQKVHFNNLEFCWQNIKPHPKQFL